MVEKLKYGLSVILTVIIVSSLAVAYFSGLLDTNRHPGKKA